MKNSRFQASQKSESLKDFKQHAIFFSLLFLVHFNYQLSSLVRLRERKVSGLLTGLVKPRAEEPSMDL